MIWLWYDKDIKRGDNMEKYLLNIPKELKSILTEEGKKNGYTLNAQMLFILWDWVKKQGLVS